MAYLMMLEKCLNAELGQLEHLPSTLMVHHITIIQSYLSSVSLKSKSNCDFDQVATRCAYILSQSAHNIHLVKTVILNVIKISKIEFIEWLLPLTHQKSMNICCLGGGPCTEVIGFLEALNSTPGYLDDMKLDIANIDMKKGWKNTFRRIMDHALIEHLHWQGTYNKHFFQADLLGDLPFNILSKLAKADVVTLIYIISSMMWSLAVCVKFLKIIFSNMKPGCMVIFADDSQSGAYKILNEVANECLLKRIYCDSKLHVRDLPVPQDYLNNYEQKYGIVPVESNISSVAIWIKTISNADYEDAVRLINVFKKN